MSINFRYTSIIIHVKQKKLSKTSTVSTDPVSRTTQNTLFSYREASCELSWVLSHVFIMVFSEWTAKGWETGGGGHKGGRGSVHWRELSTEEVLHVRTHLVKERGQPKKATVTRTGRPAHSNYRLVAAEELDLKESTVDLCMHWASSRCLSPAWWQLVQKHPDTSTGNIGFQRNYTFKIAQ